MAEYSLADLNPAGMKQNLTFLALNNVLPRVLGILTKVAPVWNVPGTNITLVTGFDEVQEVFSRQLDFEVPYEEHVEVLEWDNFVLAMQDTNRYHHVHRNIMALWKSDDVQQIADIARETATEILAGENGTIDLIQELVKPVLLAIVEQYYGVPVPAEKRQPFFDGNLAGSGFVFSGPKISEKKAEAARAAVAAVWPVIDAAMNDARGRHAGAAAEPGARGDTVLDRYYQAEIEVPTDPTDPDGPQSRVPLAEHFTEAEMRSSMMAMIGGYLPTDTNAAGRIMQTLLTDSEAMSYLRRAVSDGDDDALLQGIHEALRLNYIIPLLWRRSAGNQRLGEGRLPGNQYEIGGNRILAISLQAAMFDRRRVSDPKTFDANRPSGDSMIYGHRFHYCVGSLISDTILTELFRVVLKCDARQPPDESLRDIRWVGMYPWNMWIDYQRSAARDLA